MSYCGISVKFMSNAKCFNWSSLEMSDAAPVSVLLQQYQRNTYVCIKKEPKNGFTKSSFVTLLLVLQNALYDTKV
jgi:hypothetical protein